MMKGFLRDVLIMSVIGVGTFAALRAYSVLSKTTSEQKLAALQQEVKSKGGELFQTTMQGVPKAFLLLNCELFLLDATGDKLQRTKVLSPGFYLGLVVCNGQSISMKDEYLSVHLSNQAIGAGGGNTTGGSFRSKDGLVWV